MTGDSAYLQPARDGLAAAAAEESGIQGVLHDLGHQMMTVSMLAESLQSALPADEQSESGSDARRQAALVAQETMRALTMIAGSVAPAGQVLAPRAVAEQLVDVRELAARVARLTELDGLSSVRLTPGPAAFMKADPAVVWRVLTNLVGNAVRAAGPAGHVEIGISRGTGTIIEVCDDGPGFGEGPAGMAGRGLAVVADLLAATGGGLEVLSGHGGGTCARATFGGRCDRIVLPRPSGRKVVTA
jgi:signal transduction histidine kinase